jgi:hypothetical protein
VSESYIRQRTNAILHDAKAFHEVLPEMHGASIVAVCRKCKRTTLQDMALPREMRLAGGRQRPGKID